MDLDSPLEYIQSDAQQSALASFTKLDPTRVWTPRELARFVSIGGRGPVIVGSPETVADELERWMVEADIDGFNISCAVRPADQEDFVRLVSPDSAAAAYCPKPLKDKHSAKPCSAKGHAWPTTITAQVSARRPSRLRSCNFGCSRRAAQSAGADNRRLWCFGYKYLALKRPSPLIPASTSRPRD